MTHPVTGVKNCHRNECCGDIACRHYQTASTVSPSVTVASGGDTFAARLIALMTELGVSNRELARRLTPPSRSAKDYDTAMKARLRQVNQWRKMSTSPREKNLKRIAAALKVDVARLRPAMTSEAEVDAIRSQFEQERRGRLRAERAARRAEQAAERAQSEADRLKEQIQRLERIQQVQQEPPTHGSGTQGHGP